MLPPMAETEPLMKSAHMAGEQPARILVVDDNPATLYSTSRVLRAANFVVTEAATGHDALNLAFAGRADLVLLDVNLPDIHGFEVCQQLRNNHQTARLPIIHVSATFVTDTDKAQGLDAGSDGYLTHPVEPPVLIATVKAFLRARRAEEGLGESNARFKAIFDNALSGILLLDDDLGVLEVNPAMCRVLNRSREEIIGHSLSALLVPGEEHAAEIPAKLLAERAWRGAFPLARSDGQTVHFEWYISAQSFPNVAIATDISERIAMEEQRHELLASERAARAEAERANRLKDEFLGNLSHELRTPLNSILLWAQTLQLRMEDRHQLVQGLQAIERNTRVQTQLISDLLDVSRITSGKLRLDIQPTNPASVVKAALDVLAPAATAKDMTIETEIDQSAGLVSGDPSRLQQIVWNLVNNAIKFTPKGGRVEVQLQRVQSNVEINVTDNGQGVSAELLPFLFERFRQGDTGKDRMHGGLGLGLAIVKHLIELHGGSVSATSEGVGRGARFTVCLPVIAVYDSASSADAASFARSSAAPGEALEHLEGVRALIVDDDPDASAVVARILTQAGATVASAGSVDEALLRLPLFNPNVLVSDIGMPGRDGYDLIRTVRAKGFSDDRLPAVALTALARPEDRRRALLEGFQMHIAKPNDAAELTSAIASLVGRRGPPVGPTSTEPSGALQAGPENSPNGEVSDRSRGFGRLRRAFRELTSGVRRNH